MASISPQRRKKQISAAEGYLELDMPRHALAALNELDDGSEPEFAVNFLRGEIHRHLKDHDAALKSLERAYRQNADDVALLMAMAWCFKRTGRLPRAIDCMEQAYRVSPETPVILYNLSCYWSLAGDKTQALSWLGRALRMDASLRKLIPEESDFDALRRDPDFRMIVDTVDAVHNP